MKYYLNIKEGKKEVKFGDTIVLTDEGKGKDYAYVIKKSFTFNRNNVDDLIKDGIIITTSESKVDIPTDLNLYLSLVANGKMSSSALLSQVMMQIAKKLDTKYADHISNSRDIYVVSSLNGKIVKINKAVVKNYKNFAAFRSIEDAKIACRICSPLLREMYHD